MNVTTFLYESDPKGLTSVVFDGEDAIVKHAATTLRVPLSSPGRWATVADSGDRPDWAQHVIVTTAVMVTFCSSECDEQPFTRFCPAVQQDVIEGRKRLIDARLHIAERLGWKQSTMDKLSEGELCELADRLRSA